MKSIFFKLSSLSLWLFPILLIGCYQENEPIPRLESDLPLFSRINIAQNITVNIRNGSQRVEISGDGDLNGVVAQVANGELNIYSRDQPQVSNIVANIWLENLEQLICRENSVTYFPDEFTSSSDVLTILGRNNAVINMSRNFVFDSLYFGLRDASKLAIAALQSVDMVGDMRNASRCNIEGLTTSLSLVITDGSRFNLDADDALFPVEEPIQAENCLITARNGAAAWVYPTGTLEAIVSDGSIVYYKGNSSSIERNLTNGGQLLAKQE